MDTPPRTDAVVGPAAELTGPLAAEPATEASLAAELRESMVLLGVAVTVTLGVTAAAQGLLTMVG